MATLKVKARSPFWYIQFKDSRGNWVTKATKYRRDNERQTKEARMRCQENSRQEKQARKQAREISLREAPSVPLTMEANPGEQQLALRSNHYIQRFTANLPEQNSQVFRLCYYKGLSTQAVANLLGQNEEEVKQSLQAAMIEFRKYLQTNWS